MNTKVQGAIGVAKAISYYASKGYPVFTPVSDISRFDLIADIDGELTRIEVKTTNTKSNAVMLRTLGGNQSWNGEVKRPSKENCDRLYLVSLNNSVEKEFLIEELEGRSSIVLA